MFLKDVAKATAQVLDPKFRSVLLKSLAITIATLAGMVWLADFALSYIPAISFTIPLVGWEVTFLDETAKDLGLGLAIVLSMFLMFPVAAIIIGFFLEEIADAVEARHYPQLPPARRQSWGEILINALEFFMTLVGANILALLVYLVLLPIAWVPFLIVNGYLLGREYFELVAMRRTPLHEVKGLRKKYFMRIWLAGIVMAAPLSIPILNLLVPVVGVAAFTHMYHRLTGRGRPAPGTVVSPG